MRKRSIFLCLILIIASFFAACSPNTGAKKTLSVTDVGETSSGGFVTYQNADEEKGRTIYAGDDVVFTFFVNSGWALDSFMVNDNEMIMFRAQDGTITVENVKSNIEYAASFVPLYTIDTTANEGGNITANASKVKSGGNVLITVTANSGYKLDSFTDNGVDVTSAIVNNKYTLSSVSANHNLVATFSAVLEPLSITDVGIQSTGGFVTYQNADEEKGRTIYAGDDVVFTPFENEGWVLDSFKVNGNEIISFRAQDGTITLTNVKSNVEYAATFVRVYNVNTSANEGGSITADVSKVKSGESVQISITANFGYKLDSLTDNGTDVTSAILNGKYTISSVSANHLIVATFVVKEPPVEDTLSVTDVGESSAGGFVTWTNADATKNKVYKGDDVVFSFFENSGWVLDSFKVNGNEMIMFRAQDGKITLQNVQADIEYSATFVRVYSITATSNAGGSITANASKVKAGESVQISITANAGYAVSSLTDNGTDVTSAILNGKYTLSSVSANHTVAVTFVAIEYNVYYVLGGGTNSADNPAEYTVEDAVTLKVATRDYYDFAGWSNGGAITLGSTGDKTFTAQWTATVYDITYVLGGGTNDSDNPATYTIESDAITLEDPTREYYTFAGWTEGSEIAAGSHGDKTFTATWTAVEYDITYVLNGGTNNADNPDNYTVEDAITLEDPTRVGYTFAGWTEGSEIAAGSHGDKTFTATWTANEDTAYTVKHYKQNVADDGYTLSDTDNLNGTTATEITATAKEYAHFTCITSDLDGVIAADGSLIISVYYDRDTYTVTFDGNGGTLVSGTEVQTVKYEGDATAPAYSLNGYTFAGFDAAYTNVSADVTATATWTATEYDITYVLNGGTNNANNPDTYTIEDETITLEDPTRTGYDFVVWTEGDTIAAGSTGNKTFTASWSATVYTITYVLNGGTNNANNPSSYTIESAPITLEDPTRAGYTFAGWEEGGEIAMGSFGDKTFTASWSANGDTAYTVNYYKQNLADNDYTLAETLNLSGTVGVQVTAPARSYAHFTCVDSSVSGTVLEDGSLELDVYFDRDVYTVTFAGNGGTLTSGTAVQSIKYEGNATAPTYTRSGYIFNGFDVAYTGVSADTTVTAQWTAISYTITYVLDGGTNNANNPATYTIESVAITLENPTRDGYTFAGWSDGGTIVAGSIGDKTFTASWTATSYTITYVLNGGTNNANNPATYTIESATITLADPTRAGYDFAGWSNGGTIAHGSTGNKTFTASWTLTPPSFNVTDVGEQSAGGSVLWANSDTSKQKIFAGDDVVFTISVNSGWDLEHFYVDGDDMIMFIEQGTIIYEDVQADVEFEATFVRVYTITTSANAGGSLSAPSTVKAGNNVRITITTNSGYVLSSLTDNGVDVTSSIVNNKYTISSVSADHTVVANFIELATLTVPTSVTGGSIEVLDEVVTGATVRIKATADSGYTLTAFTFDGVDVLSSVSGGVYTVASMPGGAHTATAAFTTTRQYTITADISGGAVVEYPSTLMTGETLTVRITSMPANYAVSIFAINGVNVKSELSNNLVYVKENITEDIDIRIVVRETGVVQLTQPANGTISASLDRCAPGDEITVTFTPNNYYELASLTFDGVDVTSSVNNNVCVCTATKYGASIVAVTRPKSYQLSLTIPNGHGTARFAKDGVTVTTATVEDEIIIITKPSAGYMFKSATVGGVTLSKSGNNASLPTITGNVSAEITFDYKDDVVYSGKVVYSDGTPFVGASVNVDGTYKATTNSQGLFSFVSTSAGHTVTATATGYVTGEIATAFTTEDEVDISTAITLIGETARVVGSTVGAYSSDFTGSTITYDSATNSEKITASGSFSGAPLYLKGMQVEDGLVFFSITNKTSTTGGWGTYEADPGIGFILNSPDFTLISHITSARVRFLPNGTYDTSRDYMPAVYVSNDAGFDVSSNGSWKKYYFAFAKLGDTVYYFYKYSDGTYRVIASYTTDSLNGAFAFGFIGATSGNTANIEINDITISHSSSQINSMLASSVEVTSANGIVVYDDPYAGKTVNIHVKSDEGYSLSSLSLNGKSVAFSNDANGIYSASATLDGGTNALVATYAAASSSLAITDGTANDDNSLAYDSSLFYRNDRQINGADPGVIYVSEDSDPINGGYFYMAITNGGTSQAFKIYKSKDLTNWQRCSDNGNSGYALKMNSSTDWTTDMYWAPELMQETYVTASGVTKNRYYIYYSALSKKGNSSTAYSSTSCTTDSTKYDRFYLGIGVSDYPQGPYTQVDTSTYYKWYDSNLLGSNQPNSSTYSSFYGSYSASSITGKTTNLNGQVANEAAPPFNFYKYHSGVQSAMGSSKDFWPCIDITPFKDPATGQFYVYFSQHDSSVSNGNVIWVMKMKDFITPDYSSSGDTAMHIVSIPGYTVKDTSLRVYKHSTSSSLANKSSYSSHITRFSYDGKNTGFGINEGSQVIAHYDSKANTYLYYLTYSPIGYTYRLYSVIQAVSTSPFGPFIKIKPQQGMVVMGIENGYHSSSSSGATWIDENTSLDYTQEYDLSASIDYTAGDGHHCFVWAGNELYSVYHSFPNGVVNYTLDDRKATGSEFLGRYISVDRVNFAASPVVTLNYLTNNTYYGNGSDPLDLLYGNGPTYSLQPKPAMVTGYENVASKATVTSTGSYSMSSVIGPSGTAVTDSTKFLTDGLFVVHSAYKDWEYRNTYSGNQTITMTFSTPQKVRSVMVYNSAYYKYALKTLRSLKLYLTNGTTVTKTNLTQNENNAYPAKEVMRYGGSIIADFEEVEINKIEITFSPTDKFKPSTGNEVRIGDIKVLARKSGAAQTSVSYGQYGGAVDEEFVLDGVADDCGWQGITPYVYEGPNYSAQVKAVPSRSGVYVTATVFDRAQFYTNNGGTSTDMAGALNRWYKHTELDLYVFAGDAKNYTCDKAMKGRFSLSNMISTWGMSGASSYVGDGMSNDADNFSFTAEGFVSYADLGISSATEAYVAVQYFRPEYVSSTSYSRPSRFIGGDYRLINEMLMFNSSGYHGAASGYGDSGDGYGVETGEWKVIDGGVQSTSTMQSTTYVQGATSDSFEFKTSIKADIGMNPYAWAGFTLSDGNHTYTYALDLNQRTAGYYINRLIIYSMMDYTDLAVAYDDGGALEDDYRSKSLNLALIKKGNTIYISVNGILVYFETDDKFAGIMSAGLYSRFVTMTFKNIEFNDYSGDEAGLYEAASLPLNVKLNGSASANANVKCSLSSSGYYTAKISAKSIRNSQGVSSITVNGQSLSLSDGVGTRTINSDILVAVSTASETTYTVSGKVYDSKTSYLDARIVFKNGNKSYECYTNGGSYSIKLPNGTYTTTVYVPYREGRAQYITVSSAAKTADLIATDTILGAAVSALGVSASEPPMSPDGTTFTTYDDKDNLTTWFSGAATSALIDFTIESWLNTSGLISGTYETSQTMGIKFATASKTSMIGIMNNGIRALPTGYYDGSDTYVSGLLSQNANANGNITRIRAIYYNNIWTFYEWQSTKYVKVYEYNCSSHGANTGSVYFGLCFNTSRQINRVRMTNIAFVTGDSTVAAFYNALAAN